MLLFTILSVILVVIILIYYFKIENCKDRYTELKRNIEANIDNNKATSLKLDKLTTKKMLQNDRLEEFQNSENESNNSKLTLDEYMKELKSEDNSESKEENVNNISKEKRKNKISNDIKNSKNIKSNNKLLDKPVDKRVYIPVDKLVDKQVDMPVDIPIDKSINKDKYNCNNILEKPYLSNTNNNILPYSNQVYSPFDALPINNSKTMEFFASGNTCQSITVKHIEVPCGTPVLPTTTKYSECQPCPIDNYVPESEPMKIKPIPPQKSSCSSSHAEQQDFYIREIDDESNNSKTSIFNTVSGETHDETVSEDVTIKSIYDNKSSPYYKGTDYLFHDSQNESPDKLECTTLGSGSGSNKEKCLQQNAKKDGYHYVYNDGKGTKKAACGQAANCWCCRRKMVNESKNLYNI